MQKDIYGQFENTFMMYLPRLCEHCLNPSCVASCPSGSIYKREEDGIVLIDQDKCRGWRMCVSGCPYKKIYYNWTSGKAEKCIFCYPRIEAGQPTVCSETCVGRIRYLGVLLYDADGIEQRRLASRTSRISTRRSSSSSSIRTIRRSRRRRAPTACPTTGSRRRKRSPAYKMAVDWKIAFPLHPEYRTLPMVWYVPPLSPIQSHANAGAIEANGEIPDVRSLRIPVRYLANLLTAGGGGADRRARSSACSPCASISAGASSARAADSRVLDQAGLTVAQVEDMHRYLAIANYEDRFVIPTSHREEAEDAYGLQGLMRLHLRQWLRFRAAAFDAVRRQDGAPQADARTPARHLRRTAMLLFKAFSALLSYPSRGNAAGAAGDRRSRQDGAAARSAPPRRSLRI